MTESGEALRSPAGSLVATTKRPISQRHPHRQQSAASLKQKVSGAVDRSALSRLGAAVPVAMGY